LSAEKAIAAQPAASAEAEFSLFSKNYSSKFKF
jgi:hypothetical protein